MLRGILPLLFDLSDNPQRLRIAFKASECAHAFVKRLLAIMAERRVTDVMQ
jgi:hypothetical protein